MNFSVYVIACQELAFRGEYQKYEKVQFSLSSTKHLQLCALATCFSQSFLLSPQLWKEEV